jgi:hypothetical protein
LLKVLDPQFCQWHRKENYLQIELGPLGSLIFDLGILDQTRLDFGKSQLEDASKI